MWIIIAFTVGFITDIVWARYFRTVADHKAVSAANWSVAIYLCGVYATYLLIDKEYMAMLAFACGGYLGTYLTVRYGENK